MLLGDILARLSNDSVTSEMILALGGLRMLASVRQLAEVENMDLTTYAHAALQRYAAAASDEEWITLVGVMNSGSDPGLAYIKRAIESELANRVRSMKGVAP